jgi:hypothetical protein
MEIEDEELRGVSHADDEVVVPRHGQSPEPELDGG